MTLDFVAAMEEALQSLPVQACIRKIFSEELAKNAADTWMSAKQAARHYYGREGCEERFRKLRSRTDLDQFSTGTGKSRRWKRADLDQWMKTRAGK